MVRVTTLAFVGSFPVYRRRRLERGKVLLRESALMKLFAVGRYDSLGAADFVADSVELAGD